SSSQRVPPPVSAAKRWRSTSVNAQTAVAVESDELANSPTQNPSGVRCDSRCVRAFAYASASRSRVIRVCFVAGDVFTLVVMQSLFAPLAFFAREKFLKTDAFSCE